jgi:hypothetical protein
MNQQREILDSEIDRPALGAPVPAEGNQTPAVCPAALVRRWVLVRAWDGGLLAGFDDETKARRAMAGLDDDEVVVLCAGLCSG